MVVLGIRIVGRVGGVTLGTVVEVVDKEDTENPVDDTDVASEVVDDNLMSLLFVVVNEAVTVARTVVLPYKSPASSPFGPVVSFPGTS